MNCGSGDDEGDGVGAGAGLSLLCLGSVDEAFVIDEERRLGGGPVLEVL